MRIRFNSEIVGILLLIFLLFIIILCVSRKIVEGYDHQNFLAIICRIRNEEFMMKTFIPYYISQGVDKIYLIDDNRFNDALYPETVTNNKHVEFIRSSDIPNNSSDKKNIIEEMVNANIVYKRIRPFTKWVMNIDADEFIYTKNDKTIRETLITDFKEADLIFIPWVMFSNNGREFDGDDILIDNVHRWNHDKRHDTGFAKTGGRFDKIECKPIFKAEFFESFKNPHTPTEQNKKEINIVDGVTNLPRKPSDSFRYFNFRESHIKNAIFLCNHYRFSSIERIKLKCDKKSLIGYKKIDEDKCVRLSIEGDFPEKVDEYLKNKWIVLKRQTTNGY